MYEFLIDSNEYIINIQKTIIVTIFLVLATRILLKKAPKKYSYFLWIILILRIIFPITFKTNFSIFNLEKILTPIINSEKIKDFLLIVQPRYYMESIHINDIIGYYTHIPGYPLINVDQISLATLWLFGVIFILIYSIGTYFQTKSELKTAIRLEKNIYQSEKYNSPFVIGYIKPKIIIPYNLDEQTKRIVIEHENLHIKRKDHIGRLVFYIFVIVYWMNPLIWIAYHLFIKDMEMSCDEYVLSNNEKINKLYSNTLLAIAIKNEFKLPRPLAFGESSIKTRIINSLNFKKVSKKRNIIYICLCLFSLFAFGTDPSNQNNISNLLLENGIENIIKLDITEQGYKYELDNWLHIDNAMEYFDYIKISRNVNNYEIKEINCIYTIYNQENKTIEVKFVNNYEAIVFTSNNESKIYKVINDEMLRELNLKRDSKNFYTEFENEINGINTRNIARIRLNEIYHTPEFTLKEKGFLVVGEIGVNYCYESCDYVITKDTITLISRENNNVYVFDIKIENEVIKLLFNESKSNVSNKELIEILNKLEFGEDAVW